MKKKKIMFILICMIVVITIIASGLIYLSNIGYFKHSKNSIDDEDKYYDDRFIGKWQRNDTIDNTTTMQFYSNGNLTMSNYNNRITTWFNYEARLYIVYDGDYGDGMTFFFFRSNNQLIAINTLSDGNQITYEYNRLS